MRSRDPSKKSVNSSEQTASDPHAVCVSYMCLPTVQFEYVHLSPTYIARQSNPEAVSCGRCFAGIVSMYNAYVRHVFPLGSKNVRRQHFGTLIDSKFALTCLRQTPK